MRKLEIFCLIDTAFIPHVRFNVLSTSDQSRRLKLRLLQVF